MATATNTSDSKSKEFKQTNDSAPSEVKKAQDPQETIEALIHSGRELASNYALAKRSEIEQYATEMLTMAQDNLVNAIDSTVQDVSASLELALDKSKESITRFADEVSSSVHASVKKIDAKPVMPVVASFIGGCMLGVFLGMRSDAVRKLFSNPDSRRKVTDSVTRRNSSKAA